MASSTQKFDPLVMTDTLLLNMAIEIVDLGIERLILHGYIRLSEGKIFFSMTLWDDIFG